MTAWDIKASGVRKVLENTGKTAETMGKTGEEIANSAEWAGKTAGTVKEGGVPGDLTPGLVAAAINEFMAKRQKDFLYLALRTRASISGAVQATDEYNNGQLEMAAKKQRQAFDDPDVQAVLDKARKDAAK
ncbi:DUF6507 family protein [Streptomyces sp. NPDC048442]|uniref:DUF6507 family protein n=1 Tax=Streptomyces sp. NPDC048442 TaxID=3154823 RepID=UPI0034126E19